MSASAAAAIHEVRWSMRATFLTAGCEVDATPVQMTLSVAHICERRWILGD